MLNILSQIQIALGLVKLRQNNVILFFTLFVFHSFLTFASNSSIGVRTVVIDAGHGGKDPGAIGINGLQEKDIALHCALGLGERIKKQYDDVKIIYTRDTDVFITLYNRAKIANEANADLFISIHANSVAGASKTAYGTETWVLGLHKTKENLEVAKRENSTILLEDDYQLQYDGFDPNSDESYIALSLQQSVFLDQSLSIASKIQNEFKSIGRRDRGVKQAGFLVLAQTTMPSILIETGFVSHTAEGPYLADKTNLDKLTDGIFKAFVKYKSDVEGVVTIEKAEPVKQPVKEEIKEEPKLSSESDINFYVQVGSSVNKLETKAYNFKGLNGVEELMQGKTYKYLYGKTSDFDVALESQAMIREKYFKDAFIVAYKLGQKINVSEAIKELKAQNTQ